MFQRPPLALVASILLAALCSCSPSRSTSVAGEREASPGPAWYALENGRLVEVIGGELPTTSVGGFVPWTTAERVGGFARVGGAVYAAVNGYGVARIAREQAEAPALPGGFAYFYDRSLFRGRTLQAMLPEADVLLCHVYRNALLADSAGGDEPALPNLVRMRLGAEGYEADFLMPPFQSSAPGWQIVSVARAAAGPVWLEWKRAVADRIEFAYTTFDPATREEKAVSRGEFREAHGSVNLAEFSPRPGLALDLLLARLASSARESDYLHITVNGGAAPAHYVRVPAGGGHATRESTVYAEPGRAVALEPDGTLLAAVDGSSEVQSSRLPPLPPGYVYSAFFVAGTTLIAAWEQIDFYRVGRAGLVLKAAAF